MSEPGVFGIPAQNGLYYVNRDGSCVWCLTNDRGTPQPSPIELAVMLALLRYVLAEYEGGE